MNHWKINNMTNRNLLIQQNENDVSIVEPLNNGSFKILSEFKLNTPSLPINTYDDQLYVSINFKNEEINIYNKSIKYYYNYYIININIYLTFYYFFKTI